MSDIRGNTPVLALLKCSMKTTRLHIGGDLSLLYTEIAVQKYDGIASPKITRLTELSHPDRNRAAIPSRVTLFRQG